MTPREASGRPFSLPVRVFRFFWLPLAGILFCLTPVSAVLVVGWGVRVMRRSTVLYWYRRSDACAQGRSMAETVDDPEIMAELVAWPNWIMGTRRPSQERGRLGALVDAGFGSLWLNLKLGLSMLLCTWIITLPAGAIWLLSWWGGWENSFNKVYEQAGGPVIVALIGTAYFLAIMLVVPLAQARLSTLR